MSFKFLLIPLLLLHGMGGLPFDVNKDRPFHLVGKIRIDGDSRFLGQQWDYGSGGRGRGSIPFGSSKLGKFSKSPKHKYWKFDIGPWGIIYDPKLDKNRENIELHPLKRWQFSLGCVSIPLDQFPKLKDDIIELQKEWGSVYMNRLPTGNISLTREPLFSDIDEKIYKQPPQPDDIYHKEQISDFPLNHDDVG